MFVLEAQHLLKQYGGRTVVDDVSISVRRREIVGLLGRNGAGKTTCFRMVMGMIAADGGRVIFEGHDVSNLPMYKRARLGMGYLAQDPSVFQRLTVRENLLAILETRPLTRTEQVEAADRLMQQFELGHLSSQAARTLSGGERRKLEIARALVTEPSLILLDEPFTAVDPLAVEELQIEIRRLREEQNIAILVTDHNVERTLEVCDRAYIIDEGKVRFEGEPRELIKDQLVRDVYLGRTFKGDEFG